MARRRSRGNTRKAVMALVVALLAGALGIATDGSAPILQRLGLPAETTAGAADQSGREAESARTLASIPAYGDSPYVYIAADGDHPQGAPVFTDTELARAASGAFESYSPLDALGRCGTALACVGRETMPTAERGDIGSVHPTGWRQRFYDFVDDRALYNRCHLIAHALAGEDGRGVHRPDGQPCAVPGDAHLLRRRARGARRPYGGAVRGGRRRGRPPERVLLQRGAGRGHRLCDRGQLGGVAARDPERYPVGDQGPPTPGAASAGAAGTSRITRATHVTGATPWGTPSR